MAEIVVSLDMANTKPFVQIACFCENVLEDKDKVISAIRIVDTYYLGFPTVPEGVIVPEGMKPVLDLTGVIGLKSGDLRGSYNIKLVMRKPTGERLEVSPKGGWPIVLNGGAHGFNLRMKSKIALAPSEMGLFWFDVLFGEELLTSMPLNLIIGEQPEQAKG